MWFKFLVRFISAFIVALLFLSFGSNHSFADSAIQYADKVVSSDSCWTNTSNILGFSDGLTADCTTTYSSLQDIKVNFPAFNIPSDATVDRLVFHVTVKGTSGKRAWVYHNGNYLCHADVGGEGDIPVYTPSSAYILSTQDVIITRLISCPVLQPYYINSILTFETAQTYSHPAGTTQIDSVSLQVDYTPKVISTPTPAPIISAIGIWQNKGDINIQRYFHTATLLNAGKVLIVGGESSGLSVRKTGIYDPSTEKWSFAGLSNNGRRYHTANNITTTNVTGGNSVLVVGGHELSGAGYLNNAELYDPITNTWIYTPNMNSKRAFHASSVINNRVLITGGENGVATLNTVEEYNPIINTWVAKAPLNTHRRYHEQISFNDAQDKSKIIVIGGIGQNGNFLKSTEIYDPATNIWSIGPEMNFPHYDFSSVLLQDGRILVAGTDYPNDTISEIYDPASNTWSTSTMNQMFRHSGALAMVRNGPNYNVIAAGGNTSATVSAQLFDPSTNKWSNAASMNTPRGRFSLTSLDDGSVLAASGLSPGSGATRTSEVYTIGEVLGDSTVAPFLDLPWNYEGKNLTFAKAALAINSYFDHQYPLQGRGLDLKEPSDALNSIVPFMGLPQRKQPEFWYSNHDGYDYGTDAGVHDGDPVLPAAPGTATYEYDASGGNTILIDHHNKYQTRYYHLQDDLVKTPREVNRSTVIGRVGSTGSHTSGPHIHIGVFQDKNNDGNFEDNEPDGATDPFGWMPFASSEDRDPDPWEKYSFEYTGKQRTGNKSLYLWKNEIPGLKQELTASGAEFNIENNNIKLDPDTSLAGLELDAHLEPQVKGFDSLKSIGPAISIVLKDALGKIITDLTKPILRISISFSDGDVYRFKPGSLAIYSSSDMTNWKKEDSAVDIVDKKVTIKIDHLTHFALMGERIDTVAPTTSLQLLGLHGEGDWYRSDVQINLDANDNDGGLGVDNTQIKVDDNEWQTYDESITVTTEGIHKISYYSMDKDSNIEAVKATDFAIDKTSPVTTSKIDGIQGDGGWFTSDVSVALTATDSASGVAKTEYSLDGGETYRNYEDKIAVGKEGINELLYRSVDKAGNVENGKKLTIKIDKTPPISLVYKSGLRGVDNWYRSNVEVGINGNDDISGYQTSYYSLDDGENYTEVTDVIMLEDEEEHKIYYYSVDKAGNEEEKKSLVVKIDKTAPIITINAAPNNLWPPNGKMVNVRVTGDVQEDHADKTMFKVTDEYGMVEPVLSGFNQIIKLEAKRNGNDSDGRIYLIESSAEDFAGNRGSAQTKVIVPHEHMN